MAAAAVEAAEAEEWRRLLRAVTRLQALARGFLLRRRLRSLRAEYEEVVLEIEGDLSELRWRGRYLPRPFFVPKKAEVGKCSALQEAASSDKDSTEKAQLELDASKPERDWGCSTGVKPTAWLQSKKELSPTGGHDVASPRNLGAGRDKSAEKRCSAPAESREWQNTNTSSVSSVWDSSVLEPGSLGASLEIPHEDVKELPRTQSGLRAYRNHLIMELLWLQQAIVSRKNYLRLKQRLGTPDGLFDVASSLAHNFLLLQPWRRPVAQVTAEEGQQNTQAAGQKEKLAGAPRCALHWSVCLSGRWGLPNLGGMSSPGLALAPPAKNVVVYRNGDPFFHGRKFVVNQRQFLTFEAFLNEVTKSIRAPLAVRNLYTPRHGHRIAELGDLQDGCQYVAAGFEKFKRLDYLNHGRKVLHGTSNRNGVQSHTVAPWKSNMAARRQKPTQLTIHVFRNGDLLSPPFQLMLSKSPPLQWDTLLAMLTAKADLCSGAVTKLCRLDGMQVVSGEELLNGGYYVAVGTEEYKKLPYFELLVPQDSACRTLWHGLQTNHKRLWQGKGVPAILKTKSTG